MLSSASALARLKRHRFSDSSAINGPTLTSAVVTEMMVKSKSAHNSRSRNCVDALICAVDRKGSFLILTNGFDSACQFFYSFFFVDSCSDIASLKWNNASRGPGPVLEVVWGRLLIGFETMIFCSYRSHHFQHCNCFESPFVRP